MELHIFVDLTLSTNIEELDEVENIIADAEVRLNKLNAFGKFKVDYDIIGTETN